MDTSVTTKAEFSFRFEGENEINAALLAQAIFGFSEFVFLLNKQNPEGNEYVLNVKAHKPGSFEVFFAAVANMMQTALPFAVQQASTVVSAIKGALEIKKLLKGEKPAKVVNVAETGMVEVTAKDGTHVIAPYGSSIVFTNPRAEQSITKISESAKLHNPKGGFWIADESEEIYYNSEDVRSIAIPTHFAEMTSQTNIQRVRTTLPIIALALVGESSWHFRYAGRQITAKITDQIFLGSIHRTTSYKSGDKLDVDLEIQTVISPSGDIAREKYEITKVYGIAPTFTQMSID